MIFGVTARPTSRVACELDLKKGSQKASNFGSAVFGRDVPGGDRRNVDGGTPGGVAAAALQELQLPVVSHEVCSNTIGTFGRGKVGIIITTQFTQIIRQ